MPQIEQKISPFLWFDSQADEAADFYCNIFPNSAKGRVTRYSAAFPGRTGKVMTVTFQLFGLQFTALNGLSDKGEPDFRFTPAISSRLTRISEKLSERSISASWSTSSRIRISSRLRFCSRSAPEKRQTTGRPAVLGLAHSLSSAIPNRRFTASGERTLRLIVPREQ